MTDSSNQRPRGRLDLAKALTKHDDLDSVREDAEFGHFDFDKPYTRVVSVPAIDLAGFRERYRLSQAGFAQRFGLSLRTIQQWEQRRSKPDQPTRLLLAMIEYAPTVVANLVLEIVRESRAKRSRSSFADNLSATISLTLRSLDKSPSDSLRAMPVPSLFHPRSKVVATDPNDDKYYAQI